MFSKVKGNIVIVDRKKAEEAYEAALQIGGNNEISGLENTAMMGLAMGMSLLASYDFEKAEDFAMSVFVLAHKLECEVCQIEEEMNRLFNGDFGFEEGSN